MESGYPRKRNALHDHFRLLMPETADNFDDPMTFTSADSVHSAQEAELPISRLSSRIRVLHTARPRIGMNRRKSWPGK
jgi:hypothetical protein